MAVLREFTCNLYMSAVGDGHRIQIRREKMDLISIFPIVEARVQAASSTVA
jgi:hypothetical protein